jgi:hypothetical protein
MTGECFGWNNSVTGDYFSTGKFDSMINFHFQPVGNTNAPLREPPRPWAIGRRSRA